MCYLCEKYNKSITIQYHIADCCYLDTQAAFVGLKNRLDLTKVPSEWNSFICRGLTVIELGKFVNTFSADNTS